MFRWICGFFLVIFAGGVALGQSGLPVSGGEQLWKNKNLHWLLIGELHGSNEAPAMFFDLVSQARTSGRKIVVALERPTSEQAFLAGVLLDRNLSVARNKLLQQPAWADGMDGRASNAMLQLLVSLRNLNRKRGGISLAAFDAPFSGSEPGARDKALGQALLAIGNEHPDSLIMVYIGNAHAMTAPQFGYETAAMFLPSKQRLTLEVTDQSGESWATIGGACGVHKGAVGNKGIEKPRGIYLEPALAPFGRVDGIVSLGLPLTASEPAAGIPTPLPDCRRKFLDQIARATQH